MNKFRAYIHIHVFRPSRNRSWIYAEKGYFDLSFSLLILLGSGKETFPKILIQISGLFSRICDWRSCIMAKTFFLSQSWLLLCALFLTTVLQWQSTLVTLKVKNVWLLTSNELLSQSFPRCLLVHNFSEQHPSIHLWPTILFHTLKCS